jgi:hypothetical protein
MLITMFQDNHTNILVEVQAMHCTKYLEQWRNHWACGVKSYRDYFEGYNIDSKANIFVMKKKSSLFAPCSEDHGLKNVQSGGGSWGSGSCTLHLWHTGNG